MNWENWKGVVMHSSIDKWCLSVHPIGGQDKKTSKTTPVLDLARTKLKKFLKEKDNESQFCNYSRKVLDIAIDWFEVALVEGHIEPSQPYIGQCIGWPLRVYNIRSLIIDFQGWCLDRGFKLVDRERDEVFSLICKKIFSVDKDKVDFPSLNECRKKFISFKAVVYKEVLHDKFKANRG